MKKMLLLLSTFALLAFSAHAQTIIFPYGSSWKYLDNGSDQGTAWRATAFNDGSWLSGNGQLGYGDGDEATVLSYGPDINNKFITSYFRRSISIANPSAYSSFTANVKRDDGVIVHINGVEVYRSNLTGTVIYTTLATMASDEGNTPQTFTINSSAFIAGNNVIAVEIHQHAGNSSDITFDMDLAGNPAPVTNTIVPYGSSWKYLANGSNQGTAWRTTSFNDASWLSGNAQLGYGDGDEATIVSYGSNAKKKYITTYFRKTITIVDVSGITGYSLNIKRDDGAVVYINGTEVFRSNMLTGTISYTTKASTAASDDGNTPQLKSLTAPQLLQGTNVIAVEMHQDAGNSTDLSFDLELKSTTAPVTPPTATLTRGPYLNSALQTGIIIRWRTNIATDSKVFFGTSPGSLSQSVTDNTSTTEHVVTLTGLSANTQYYYNIGSSSQVLQGDANNYFKTMPPVGSTQKIRILAMGDMGNNSTNQVNVRNAYQAFNSSNYTDAWLLMGDNAYTNGTDVEYQNNFFNIYQGNIAKNHVLWPSPGNHDYANSAARQADHAIPYYNIFSLPVNGQAGGVASNNEAYYSYNYGNVHFVSLDSYGWETGNTRLYDTTGPQATWLKQDLAANTQKWTVVYFHHPPYTMGSHNSDTEVELYSMRQRLVTILERYKVDLVLNGHSHSYERSYLLNGHYENETTFSLASHALSSSSAKYNGSSNSCIYIKNPTDIRNGIVYAVVGSAGQVGGSQAAYPHNAMYYSNVTNGGTLFFEVENNRLDAKWISSDGVIRDNFSIMKDVNKTTNSMINSGESTTLTASWIGSYNWSTGATTSSISVSPLSNTTYTVSDGQGCITDVFNVTVNSGFTFSKVAVTNDASLFVIPTLAKKGQVLKIQTPLQGVNEIFITDINGRLFMRNKFRSESKFETANLMPGIYFIRLVNKEKISLKKVIITE